ncbi:MAG: OmpA family protein [Planctomycetota bacterium]
MRHLGGRNMMLLGLALLPLSAGCATKQQVQEYQDEITALREERTRLKKENRELEMQLDDYAVALAEANSRTPEPVAAAPSTALSYPGLDSVGVEYGQRDGNLVLSIPSEITFASGKADLTSSGKNALRAVAKTLLSNHPDGTFWFEGHTDSDPIKKSKWASNRELSVARAMAVLHYLVEECGVTDDQCVVAGHGQYAPRDSNSSQSSKARNRRVEIVVHGSRS